MMGISMIETDDGKDAVRLVRMPTGYGYIFGSKGVVYAGGGGGGVDLKIVDLSVPTGIVPGMGAEILHNPWHIYPLECPEWPI
jgi:hypothetical protein